jgi:threonine synthase
MLSWTTSAYFGSPRVDTVEVCGSSPHGPTLSFKDLASTTFLNQAPNGSIKGVVRDSKGLHVGGRRQLRVSIAKPGGKADTMNLSNSTSQNA